MSLVRQINRPVVIFYESDSEEIDEAGNAIEDETAIETVGEIQPRRTDEPTGHPDIADTDWVGYFLPDDIPYLTAASLVWVPGSGEFEVVGDPLVWRNPRRRQLTFCEVNLNRTAGPEDDLGS